MSTIFTAPQCLIDSDVDHQVHIVPHVLQQVAALSKPLVVVAIAGKYRTGKSYLMNRLARKNSGGFSLGSTIESHTKGIWIWVKDHPLHDDRYLMLIDTEGLADPTKVDPDHDTKIFTLAVLLSSVFCYNAPNAIDNDSILSLNFITRMSEHICLSDNQADDTDLDLFFPHFVYVVRDFHLDLKRGGKVITQDQYLEGALDLKPETAPNATEYNEPRACLRKYFRNRKCFTFDFPVTDRRLMKNLDTVADDLLSEEFRKQTDEFCQYMEREGPLKHLENGQPLKNGQMWASLLETFVSSIQQGRIPCIQNAVLAMATVQNEKALEAASQMYMFHMTALFYQTTDEQVLSDAHHECVKSCTSEFLQKSFNDTGNVYQKRLLERMNTDYEVLRASNEAESRQACHNSLTWLEEEAGVKLEYGLYAYSGGYREYQADMGLVTTAYEDMTELGVKKADVLTDYMMNKWDEGQAVLAQDTDITEAERLEEAEFAIQRQLAERQAAEERERWRSMMMTQQVERTETEAVRQMEAHQRQEAQRMRQHYNQIVERRMSEQRRMLQEGFNQRAQGLRDQVARLQQRL